MRNLALFCAAALACSSGLYAQLANTTSLVGTVNDSAGAVIPGVTITAVNSATQDQYTAITNAQGDYTIQFVKTGTYNLTASHPGFQTITRGSVTVDYNQTVRSDFTLPVGQVSEHVVVTATTPPITTDDASIKETVGTRSVAELPLNGRDALQLAAITPGVLPGQKAANGVPPGEDFIGAGTREIQNSISLDGISIVNNLITTTPFHPSVDSIQEFEVQTGTYSAQYGSYLGAHLNLITKTGTNDLHGALFEFFRNDVLDARNYFQKPGTPKAPLRQNQFGFEVGGPVYIPKLYDGRNKTFFMADYEGLRLIKQVTSLDTVLTPLMRQGNFSEYPKPLRDPNKSGALVPGNVFSPTELSPQAQKALQYMPLPNLPGITSNLEATYPNNDHYNQTIDRIDQNIGDKIRLFFRYAWQNETILTGATSPFNSTFLPVSTRNWVFGYTQTISANMVNDFRVGRQNLSTDALNYWSVNGLKSAGADLGIPGFNGDTVFDNPGIPVFSISGFMTLGNAGTNWIQQDTTWQGTDSFNWTKGAHSLIFGAELRKLITTRAAVNQPLGLFTFANTPVITGYAASDFMLGYAQSDATPGPEIRNKVAEWRDGFFIVDNWHASKKLTLNLGLRYELPTVPYTANGYATILNAQQTALIPPNPPVPGFKFINPNHKDFAPRIGLAYRINDKTVFRSGYGIYYNPNQTNTFTFLSNNPPFSSIASFNSSGVNLISLNDPTPAALARKTKLSTTTIISPNPDLPTQYMNQWSADLERSLWNNAALDVQYLGSHSTHLDRSYYINTPLPGPGPVSLRRPNQIFGDIRIIQNDEMANYNGLSLILRQRFTHGLSLLASYTWSHNLDVTTDSNGGGAPMNPYNWRADYGNSNWDVRHRFVASFNYELPFFASASNGFVRQTLGGWQTNGIVNLQTGFPFNVIVSGDVANTGRSNQRPDLIGMPSNDCGDAHLSGCIDPAAFALPAHFTYGNAGRNLLYGPGLYNVDFSLFKNFSFAERVKLQFRSEFFNFFNTPAFSNPNATFGTTAFGTITSTKHDNREIQFALKLLF
ncbi:MAG TPA: TonB-dependent receptor [Bryobacteraceae bacterium]|nr:TonB-dependent receptor [Bryobacteraceae bacterium]